jgi:DUF2891 family protein
MADVAAGARLDAAVATRLADLILAAIHREYPSHVTHLLASDEDARPPRELTPAFFGSFDWHSAVHGHWALARLARMLPEEPFAIRARAGLERSLTSANVVREVAYMSAPGRAGFERPYGLAWLLQLCAELREWNDEAAARWQVALEPLEGLCAEHLRAWLPKLTWPIRTGLHSQSAFALGLALDWANVAGNGSFAALARERAITWHEDDRDAPIAYEPSGHDFLSPALGEADLVRRVMEPARFADWLERFLPNLATEAGERWLTPVTSSDRADGHLAHLDGLNLSRAWMLDAIALHLPAGDRRKAILSEAARLHGEAGLAAVTDEHYAGAHWLGTFAVYYLTRRGAGSPRGAS